DNGSDDGSLELLKNHPRVEIREFPKLENESFVLTAQKMHNDSWKESRGKADWVIMTAIDEFLIPTDNAKKNLTEYLINCRKKGVTAIPALGYQMISDEFPTTNQQ